MKEFPRLTDNQTINQHQNGNWLVTLDYGPDEESRSLYSKRVKQTTIFENELLEYLKKGAKNITISPNSHIKNLELDPDLLNAPVSSVKLEEL